jgi:hypothetical protein
MGATSSKATGSVRDPFRIDTATDRDLDTLTFVTTRVLNTPDIYDIYNLKNAGTCGEYAVFVKEVIEKRLLNQMVVKVKGKDGSESLKEIYYQNPRKLMPIEDQKQICAEVARAAIQAVTTVVACLASIQVAFSPRIVPQQRGGDIPDLKPWFLTNGILAPLPAGVDLVARKPFRMNGTPTQNSAHMEFHIILEETRGENTTGWVGVRDLNTDESKRLPITQALRINFLPDPIEVTPANSVVMVRILDHSGRPWMAGILVKVPNLGKTYLKSFVKGDENYRDFTNVIEEILRKSLGQSFSFGLNESREQVIEANKVFEQIRDTKGARLPLLQSNMPTFLQKVFGITPPTVPQQQQAPVYGAPGPYPYPGYGFPQALVQPAPQPLQPLQPPPTYQSTTGPLYPTLGPGTGPQLQAITDIPQPSAASILKIYERFKEAHNKQSNPAAVRAKALAASVTDDRQIAVASCEDPYWKEPTMAQVYPWTTLQYLCVKDLTVDPAKMEFEAEWSEFISELKQIYNTLKLTVTEGSVVMGATMVSSKLLERMSIKGMDKLSFCANPRTNNFRAIQDGLLRIQGLYEEHVKRMWAILNALIVVIEDPTRQSRIVRLHPKATTGTQRSLEYIQTRAAEARVAIKDFYLAVERTYVDTLDRAFTA